MCAKSLNFKEIMAVVVKTVNFILSRGLHHCQFQEFLKEIEAEYGKMLEQVYTLRRGF